MSRLLLPPILLLLLGCSHADDRPEKKPMPVPDRPANVQMVGEVQATEPLAEAPDATQPEAAGDTTSPSVEIRRLSGELSALQRTVDKQAKSLDKAERRIEDLEVANDDLRDELRHPGRRAAEGRRQVTARLLDAMLSQSPSDPDRAIEDLRREMFRLKERVAVLRGERAVPPLTVRRPVPSDRWQSCRHAWSIATTAAGDESTDRSPCVTEPGMLVRGTRSAATTTVRSGCAAGAVGEGRYRQRIGGRDETANRIFRTTHRADDEAFRVVL